MFGIRSIFSVPIRAQMRGRYKDGQIIDFIYLPYENKCGIIS